MWESASRSTFPSFTVSNLRLPQPGGKVSLFISTRNRVAQLYPQALGVLLSSDWLDCLVGLHDKALGRNEQEHHFLTDLILLRQADHAENTLSCIVYPASA
jgi:hypothetical protein